jgi:hypothetical protein
MSKRLIAMFILFSLQPFTFAATESFAQTAYVSTVNELSDALHKANKIGGNTDIVLSDGQYQINQRLRIIGSHIQLRSASGDPSTVILSGQGMKKSSSVEVLIDVSGSHTSLSGFTLERSANHLIQIRAENDADSFSLSNCVLRDSYEQLLKVSASHQKDSPYADDGHIENCLFEYSAGIGPQYYIGGIDAHRSRNWQVIGNTFKNIASPSIHVAEHAIHFWRKSANITVVNNVIENCDRGIGFGLGDNIANQTVGGLIETNIIKSSNPSHKFADAGIILEASPNVQIINNVVWIEGSYPRAIEYRFPTTKNVIIQNNITNKSISSRHGGQAKLIDNETAHLIDKLESKLKYITKRF